MPAKVSIANVGDAAVSMAADYALEQAAGKFPGDTVTLTRVGYLRRVPAYIEPILKAAWPYTVVKWTTVIPPKIGTHQKGFARTSIQAMTGRIVRNRHVCYPLVLLEPFLEFLRPSGKCHLAKINVGISLDPDAVVDLDMIPKTDPDF